MFCLVMSVWQVTAIRGLLYDVLFGNLNTYYLLIVWVKTTTEGGGAQYQQFPTKLREVIFILAMANLDQVVFVWGILRTSNMVNAYNNQRDVNAMLCYGIVVVAGGPLSHMSIAKTHIHWREEKPLEGLNFESGKFYSNLFFLRLLS